MPGVAIDDMILAMAVCVRVPLLDLSPTSTCTLQQPSGSSIANSGILGVPHQTEIFVECLVEILADFVLLCSFVAHVVDNPSTCPCFGRDVANRRCEFGKCPPEGWREMALVVDVVVHPVLSCRVRDVCCTSSHIDSRDLCPTKAAPLLGQCQLLGMIHVSRCCDQLPFVPCEGPLELFEHLGRLFPDVLDSSSRVCCSLVASHGGSHEPWRCILLRWLIGRLTRCNGHRSEFVVSSLAAGKEREGSRFSCWLRWHCHHSSLNRDLCSLTNLDFLFTHAGSAT